MFDLCQCRYWKGSVFEQRALFPVVWAQMWAQRDTESVRRRFWDGHENEPMPERDNHANVCSVWSKTSKIK